MAGLAHVTRNDILHVLGLCSQLSEEQFLHKYGYEKSTTYRIVFEGETYPSKAIVGVAAGLLAHQFFGGVAQAVPCLQTHGFQVLRNGRPCGDVGLRAIAKKAGLTIRAAAPAAARCSAVFASGTNRPGEIRGMAAGGMDIGVCAQELSEAAIEELIGLAGTDVQIFVDSGAFGEVQWEDLSRHGGRSLGRFVVVNPITDADWRKILQTYERLAQRLGDQVWLVAPDRIGSQEETLCRLRRYAPRLARIARTGARILVPLQKGSWSQAHFDELVRETLGETRWTPAFPCKKAATTAGDLDDYFANVRGRPGHVHLLGLGPRNSQAARFVSIARDAGCTCSLDSNWITANVGRQGKTRLYTAARDLATELLAKPAAGTVAELALLMCFGIGGAA